MSSKSRALATLGLSAASVIAIGGLLGLSGCNPHRDQLRPDTLFSQIGRQRGQIIEPKKCELRVAILNREFREPAINEAVWKAADEQAIAPEPRRALEVNGLRLGKITGELPPDLEAVLAAPPPHKVEPAAFLLDDGEQTLISVSEAVDQVSLLLNRDNRPYGKDFEAASGFFRVTAAHEGANGVALRFTPEIHHGPLQRSYQPIAGGATYSPQQFKINDGQQEESLREMTASLVLEPGQVAVLGCRTEQERSLGAFLFCQTESHKDLRRQKLILIWATRNKLGESAEKVAKTDRPIATTDAKPKSDPDAKTVARTVSQPAANSGKPRDSSR